jgi:hypothetical protein
MLDKKNIPQFVLSILLFVYLVTNVKLPDHVATTIDTATGKIIIVVIAILLFAYSNPVLGVLCLLVAYKLIQSAHIHTGMAALNEYYPTEQKKWTPFNATRQFPYTLEQEVVKNMTQQKFNAEFVKTQWRPVIEDTYDAEYVNQQDN